MSAPGPAGIFAIPVASLYNLGRREGYIERRRHWTRTRPAQLDKGERRDFFY
ncbi:MAG: hypothetical protein Q7R45_03925 [Sulfuricaulis sp.]|nr:hypothetical protein [Sulfuricaulis sp.]